VGVTVTFNYAAWVLRYPEFSDVPAELAALYFAEAGVYHNNGGTGPPQDANIQSVLMNMATAHIAKRYAVRQGQEASDLVGRISSVTQGSESAQTENDYPPGTAQWWQTTKYGADYWHATAGMRTFQYRAPPTGPVGFPF
jgi:Protein of unknown function (DUF4054)